MGVFVRPYLLPSYCICFIIKTGIRCFKNLLQESRLVQPLRSLPFFGEFYSGSPPVFIFVLVHLYLRMLFVKRDDGGCSRNLNQKVGRKGGTSSDFKKVSVLVRPSFLAAFVVSKNKSDHYSNFHCEFQSRVNSARLQEV